MLTQLFTDPQSAPAKQLAELGDHRRRLLAQQRDALTALDGANAEHYRLERFIQEREDRALALGQPAPDAKSDRAKLNKLARQVTEHSDNADRLDRALGLLDQEASDIVRDQVSVLVTDALSIHAHANDHIAELVAELHQRQAELRAAFTAAQRILTTAGHSTALHALRDVPSVETLVREGQAPALMHPADREALFDLATTQS